MKLVVGTRNTQDGNENLVFIFLNDYAAYLVGNCALLTRKFVNLGQEWMTRVAVVCVVKMLVW